MCGCAKHQTHNVPTSRPAADALVLHVADMTCGHCAATITRAIEAGMRGAEVDADPSSKTVTVRGTMDRSAVAELISAAGYTPSGAAA
jgi:copper chaperone